jgi:hyaluronan synthase
MEKRAFYGTVLLYGAYSSYNCPNHCTVQPCIFPTTFLVGILMMSLMMSFTQLFFRKSTTWIFGIYFVLFYEAVLLWQMPFAWFTFWKSTWGTRMTPEDIKEASRKKKRRFNL